ncbi:MAG TPA: DUF3341 domain-containing protein [Rhizomicrobium sp.]|jgi:hypothetical protein|nr:DUF3341 domain-containing protein [Rhizomicrobium sp.]
MSEYLLVEFLTAHETEDAARAAAEAGKPALDVLSPNPVEDIAECLAPPRSNAPIGWVMFVAGAFGAAAGYFMQWYSAVIDYPVESGGRPLNSWPAFLLVPYETTILSAAIVGILGWMWMCGLPKPFHPLFEAGITGCAVQDRYLLVFPRDKKLAAWIGSHLKPVAIHEIGE